MTIHSLVSGHYCYVNINPLNAIMQQFAVENKNCLPNQVWVPLTLCQFQVHVVIVVLK